LFTKYDEEERERLKHVENQTSTSKQLELAAVLEDFLARQASEKLAKTKSKKPTQRPDWLRRKVEAVPSSEELPESVDVDVVGHDTMEAVAPPPSSEMCAIEPDYISLPNVPLEMPCVILGSAGHRGLQGREGRAAILSALKMGYRGIDTSE